MEPRIVCAVNKLADGTKLLGIRHCDDTIRSTYLNYLEAGGEQSLATSEEGFVDQFGKFYNRREAWKIAKKSNQIIRLCDDQELCHDDQELFSENLY